MEEFYEKLLEARMFCSEDMSKIYILSDEIMATDGFKCIVIKDCTIPEDFDNKVILSGFNSLEDMSVKSFNKEDKASYESIRKALDNQFFTKKEGKVIKKKEFYNKFIVKANKKDGKELSILEDISKYDRVAINKEYLEVVLSLFKDNEDIRVHYPRTSISPLLIETESKELLIMPVKVSYGDLE